MKHKFIDKENCNSCTCCLCCTKITNLGVILGKFTILENVNLHIHCGELTAVIGPNGSGKTTLLKALLGEMNHSGELTFVDAKNIHTARPIIGYVPQKLEFDTTSTTTVFDLFVATQSNKPVWLFRFKRAREKILQSLKNVQAENVIDRKLGALSGGELQRVLLALALEPIPDLLLLDEPVSGIDHSGLNMFYKMVSEIRRNYDISIILVSHDLNLCAKYADRVVLINNKTVECQGTPKEVFSNSNVINLFGLNLFSQTKAGDE